MKKVAFILVTLCLVSAAQAGFLINDSFDDGTLDPAWVVNGQYLGNTPAMGAGNLGDSVWTSGYKALNPDTFTVVESGGAARIDLTTVTPTTWDDTDYHYFTMQQTIPTITGAFQAKLKFSWEGLGRFEMGVLRFAIGQDGGYWAGHGKMEFMDYWGGVNTPAPDKYLVTSKGPSNVLYYSEQRNHGTSTSGSMEFLIERDAANNWREYVDGVLVPAALENNGAWLNQVRIWIEGCDYSGMEEVGASLFDNFKIELVQVATPAIPEPASLGLLALGSLALLARRR